MRAKPTMALNRWFILASGVGLLLASTVLAGAQAADLPRQLDARRELDRLLSRTYQPVPQRLHFRAKVTVLSPSWSEAEVEKELRSQNQLMREHDRVLSPAQKQELYDLRRDSIRRARSGTNEYAIEIWVSGELYRKDETWTTIPNSSQRSYVFLGEPRFTNTLAYIANRSVNSVTVFTNMNWPVALDRLWEGYSIEPQLTIPVLALLADIRNLPQPTEPPPLRNFDGLRVALDDTKLQQLTNSNHPDYSLRLDETVIGDVSAVRFRFEPKHPKLDHVVHVTYWLDARDARKLYRVEARAAGQPLLVSTRAAYDNSGWPRFWTSQSLDARGRVITKQVEYLTEVDAQFDDWETFAPVFPKDYLVSVSSGSGVAELIQNPRGSRVVHEASAPSKSLLSQLVPIAICLMAIAFPLALARRLTSRKGPQ